MSKYSYERLTTMAVNPMEDNILGAYPQLRSQFPPEAVTLVRYLAWAYDPRSPLIREFPDPRKRNEKARELSAHDAVVPPEDAFWFVANIVRSRIWTMIVLTEETFQEFSEKIHKRVENGSTDKDELQAVNLKPKMIEEMVKLDATLEDLYMKLFASDKEMASIVQDKVKELTPESVAQMLKGRK